MRKTHSDIWVWQQEANAALWSQVIVTDLSYSTYPSVQRVLQHALAVQRHFFLAIRATHSSIS